MDCFLGKNQQQGFYSLHQYNSSLITRLKNWLPTQKSRSFRNTFAIMCSAKFTSNTKTKYSQYFRICFGELHFPKELSTHNILLRWVILHNCPLELIKVVFHAKRVFISMPLKHSGNDLAISYRLRERFSFETSTQPKNIGHLCVRFTMTIRFS